MYELDPCCFYSMTTFRHVDFGLRWSNLKKESVFFTLCKGANCYLVSTTCREISLVLEDSTLFNSHSGLGDTAFFIS